MVIHLDFLCLAKETRVRQLLIMSLNKALLRERELIYCSRARRDLRLVLRMI